MSTYEYVKTSLIESGIDFSKVPKDAILKSCEEYNPKLPNLIYEILLEVLEEIYKACQS